ncbi:peptidase [bacterium]|nr:MAG: peptidase [bacterium]
MRWLHTYVSMFSMLVILFFALTGIVLNHPDWSFGMAEARQEVTGTLPKEWIAGENPKWLDIAEKLRQDHALKGIVGEYQADEQEGSLTFRGPAYSADVFIKRDSGEYTVNVARQGPMAILNDLHRGKDAGKAWAWLIDLSGIFLTLISLTGFGIMLYLKKIKVKSLVTFAVGCAVLLLLMKLAT